MLFGLGSRRDSSNAWAGLTIRGGERPQRSLHSAKALCASIATTSRAAQVFFCKIAEVVGNRQTRRVNVGMRVAEVMRDFMQKDGGNLGCIDLAIGRRLYTALVEFDTCAIDRRLGQGCIMGIAITG